MRGAAQHICFCLGKPHGPRNFAACLIQHLAARRACAGGTARRSFPERPKQRRRRGDQARAPAGVHQEVRRRILSAVSRFRIDLCAHSLHLPGGPLKPSSGRLGFRFYGLVLVFKLKLRDGRVGALGRATPCRGPCASGARPFDAALTPSTLCDWAWCAQRRRNRGATPLQPASGARSDSGASGGKQRSLGGRRGEPRRCCLQLLGDPQQRPR